MGTALSSDAHHHPTARRTMMDHPRRKWVQVCLLAALFVVAATITILAIRRWRTTDTKAISQLQGSPDDIPGLAEGDLVSLPRLPGLKNDYVDLNTVKGKYILCAFISSECVGCVQDEPFWKDLRKEISDKNVAFYLISIDTDQSRVESLVNAYELQDFPVLFDPQKQAATAFKIKFVPEYVLLTPGGRVVARWNGVRRYEPKKQNATDKLKGLLERISVPLN